MFNLIRTPMLDATGGLTRPWIGFFQGLSAQTVTPVDVTLTTATQMIDNPDGSFTDGQLLPVLIRQDGTGGRAIAWASNFVAASTNLGEAKPNTVCAFLFMYTAGKWWMVAEGPKDMTP